MPKKIKSINIEDKQIIKDIKEKLYEYGFDILDCYKIEEGDEYVINSDEMILFIRYNENHVNISFPITLLPDTVANNLLIIQEVDHIESIAVLESFILTDENTMLYDEEAKQYLYLKIGQQFKPTEQNNKKYEKLFYMIDWNNCPKV